MHWLCVVILFAVPQDANPARDALSGEEVLSNLSRYDALFKTGFTAIAHHRMMERIDGPGPFYQLDSRWKLTFQDRRVGYDMEVVDYEVPKYLAPNERPWAEQAPVGLSDVAKQEAMSAVVRAREWGYWGEDSSGTFREDRTVVVQPDGKSTEGGAMHNSSLYGPDAIQPVASRTSFQLGLGRFFTDFLDKVESVHQLEDGRIQLSAIGRMPGCVGKWELVVEPDSAWIVRTAKFFESHAPQAVSTEVVTEGTVWSGPFCIPKSAKVNVFAGIEDMKSVPSTGTRHLTFEPVVEKFDEEFFKDCQQVVLHGDQERLYVTDFRSTPPVYSEPNFVETVAPVADFKPKSVRHWFIILNLVIGVFLLALGLRHYRRNSRG